MDGDTVDVTIDGRDVRIRLLNVDTPETVDPNRAVECLGPEATEFLVELLPVGTAVTLEYDADRTDRYDRTLAGMFTPAGLLVNAEIARAGLGHAVIVGNNDKFFPAVSSAQEEAKLQALGLYSSALICTVPAQIEQVVAQSDAVMAVTPAGASPEQIAAAESGAAEAVAAAVALRQVLTTDRSVIWRALPDADLAHHAGRISSAIATAQRRHNMLHDALITAQVREAAEVAAEAARVVEEQRVAAEIESARLAAEANAAEAAAVEARQLADAQTRQKSAQTKPAPKPASKSAEQPASKYTGPRCYAPGGKTWKPC